jgi:hypothetical protein
VLLPNGQRIDHANRFATLTEHKQEIERLVEAMPKAQKRDGDNLKLL